MDARKRALTVAAKHICYVLCLFAAYVLQTTPGFLSVLGIKPVLLVPLALCISVYEGAFTGALYGAVAGMLWDIAAGRAAGFFAIQLMLLCFFCAVAETLYLRDTVLNLSLLAGGTMLLLCSTDFLFSYMLHGYSGLGRLYLLRVLPTVAYSAAVTFALRALTGRISQKFVFEE